jgi:hypothetical protein
MPEWRVAVIDGEPESVRGHHTHDADDWVAASKGDVTIAEVDLRVKDEVLDFKPEAIDRILVHELLHPLLDRVLDHVELFRPYISDAVWEAYQQGLVADEEEFVNRIAHVISTHGEHGSSPYGTHEVEAGP